MFGEPRGVSTYDDGAGLALYVNGAFKYTGDGKLVNGIAKWDGSAWHDLAGGAKLIDGMPSVSGDMIVFDLGEGPELLVHGTFPNGAGGWFDAQICSWNGERWKPVASSGKPSMPMVVMDDGSGSAVFAWMSIPGGAALGRWNGVSVEPVAGIPAIGPTALVPFESGSTRVLYLSAFKWPDDPCDGASAFGRYELDCTPCSADCTRDGSLTVSDFVCFQTLFAVGDPGADCDESGRLDIEDFVCFQALFATGC